MTATQLPPTDAWDLRNPRTVFQLPAGARFPFQTTEFSVYAQLAGGLGTWDLAVEMLQVRDDGTRRFVGTSSVRPGLQFTAANQLVPVQTAFVLRRVRFREAGEYEFRVVAVTAAGSRPLDGPAAQVRILDRRARV